MQVGSVEDVRCQDSETQVGYFTRCLSLTKMPGNTSVQSKIKYFKANKHFISQNIDLQTKEPERAGDIIKGRGWGQTLREFCALL